MQTFKRASTLTSLTNQHNLVLLNGLRWPQNQRNLRTLTQKQSVELIESLKKDLGPFSWKLVGNFVGRSSWTKQTLFFATHRQWSYCLEKDTSLTLRTHITEIAKHQIWLWSKVFDTSALIGQILRSKSKWWVHLIAYKWVPIVEFDFKVCVDRRQCLTYTLKLNSTLGTFSCPSPMLHNFRVRMVYESWLGCWLTQRLTLTEIYVKLKSTWETIFWKKTKKTISAESESQAPII